MTRKRSVANASALSAVALGVAGVMLGTGVTSTAIGVSDGVTWLPNAKSGSVLQFNPVTGQVEQSVPVGAPGERITVSQRDGMVVFTNEETHEVSVFDMKQMSKSGNRKVNSTSTMLTSRDGMFLVNQGGQISRVDPATAEDMGSPASVDGLVTAVVDEAGTVWAASEDGTVRSLKWSDRSSSLREVSSQKVSGLGSDAVLTAHEKGVTVFGPDHGLIAQVGTPHDQGAVTDARMAGLVPAEHAPSDLVPATLSSAGSVVVVDRGEVRDFALPGCSKPTRPVAFNDVVYAVCEGQSKVVRVHRDGSPAGADIPTKGDAAPITDEGRLLLDVDGGTEGVEIDRKGNDKPYSRDANPVAQVRDESEDEARQSAADRARADLEVAPPQDGAAGNGDGRSDDQDQTHGKDVVDGEGEADPGVQELPADPVDQNPVEDPSDRGNGNGRGNEDKPERDNRDHPGRGNEDNPSEPGNPGNPDPGNEDPGNGGNPRDPDPGETDFPSEPVPDPTLSGGPSVPAPGEPTADPTVPLPGPTMRPSVPTLPTHKPTSTAPSPTKTTKKPTRTPSTTKPTSTKPTATKTPTKAKTTSKKPTKTPSATSGVVLSKPKVSASAKGSTVTVSWNNVAGATQYTVKVGDKKAVVVGAKMRSQNVINVAAGTHNVTVTASNKNSSNAGSAKVTVNKPKPTPTPTKTKTTTKPPAKRTLTVKKGERQNESYCTKENCRAIMVSGTGFKPNSTVTCTVRKYDGFSDHNVKVNGKGQIPSSQVGLFGYPDKEVSAKCDGTVSNTVTW